MMMMDMMQMIWCVKFKYCIGVCLLVFKGIVHIFFLSLNLIFWDMMGCGIALFGRRGPETT